MSTKLIYVDDSGYEGTGWSVYGWVEVDIAEWCTGLGAWLDWRKSLDDRYQIPVLYELHATKFAGGRGHPSRNSAWNMDVTNRHEVMEEALAVIGSASCLSVGAVYRQTDERGRRFYRHKVDTYSQLVQMLNSRFIADDNLGVIIMDGDASETIYTMAHRNLKLATRAVIEDPMFQHSHRSQWVQIADLIAYVAYQHLYRDPNKAFAWAWYSSYLMASDPNGGPQIV